MKKTTQSNCRALRLLAAALLLLTVSVSVNAYDFEAVNDDGVTIYYNKSYSGNNAYVTYKSKSYNSYSGDVIIPSQVIYLSKSYSVTQIASNAFYDCTELTSVTIPNSVTQIGNSAFYGCTGLTEVTIPNSGTTIKSDAFAYCTGLTSVTLPEGSAVMDSYAFGGCTGLTEITIPNSETYDGAFQDCTGLTQVTIGNKVTILSGSVFLDCTGLTEVNFNATACTSAGSASHPVFSGCTNLSTVTIGEGVTVLPDYLFYGCTGLTEVNFNATACTSAGSSVFNGFRNVVTVNIGENVTTIPSSLFHSLSGLTKFEVAEGNEYYCSKDGVLYSKDMTTLVLFPCSSTLLPYFEIPDGVTTIGENAFRGCTGLKQITIPENITSIGDYAFSGCTSLYSFSLSNAGQVTCQAELSYSNIYGAESGFSVSGQQFFALDGNGCSSITGLTPGKSNSVYYALKLQNGEVSIHGDKTIKTMSVNPAITLMNLTPDAVSATGSNTECDDVIETGFTDYETDGTNLLITSLEPETSYTIEYYVTLSDNSTYTTSETFTTPGVEFTTLPAKATSNTVALLGATTNLSDDAVGAGFEWRRNDAPSTMPSNQAECPVIDGELTGTLNGLSATTYYDFRPYYTSQGGTTYYGDWVTFITADAYVYFEPTVRTYSATSVGSSSATVKAYAVAGSDNITSQGFEYWEGGSSSAMNVRRASTTDENGVTRVEVSGQWMTATFEDLEPSTTYSYRAYVTTAVGTTYGETMSFTTDVPTGIEAATLTEEADVYEIARYTLDGKKVSQPQRGINIIRYSDGTVKKVMVK